jgi:hypothetical protein
MEVPPITVLRAETEPPKPGGGWFQVWDELYEAWTYMHPDYPNAIVVKTGNYYSLYVVGDGYGPIYRASFDALRGNGTGTVEGCLRKLARDAQQEHGATGKT